MDLNLPMQRVFTVAILLLCFLSSMALADDKPRRVYFIGNSVTDTIRYGSLAKLAESRGRTLTWGRDMIPGAPLSWLWKHPRDGFQQEPFGLYPRALTEYSWDVLSRVRSQKAETKKGVSVKIAELAEAEHFR